VSYPWGNTFDGMLANYCDVSCPYEWRDSTFNDGFAEWTSVGRFPDGGSWCGAMDMAGNVWEWVNDRWSEDDYTQSPTDNPQGPDSGDLRIARGGS
jgi:formylglycine-generating enzyme required for sulfatase activity